MNVHLGDRLYLKSNYAPKLHPEVEPIELPQGTEGQVFEFDDEAIEHVQKNTGRNVSTADDATHVGIAFDAYNLHVIFNKEELDNLFTRLWIPA